MAASLTSAGPILDTQASAFAEWAARVRQLYDADLVITQDSDLGKIGVIFSEANVSNQQFLSTVIDQLDVNNATGVQLIVLGAINGVAPLAATRSTIALRLGGGGNPLPDVSDKRVRYEPSGAVFRIPLNTVIPIGGTIDVEATADSTGPLVALEAASVDWVIVDGVTGWDSVESTSDAVPGRDVETQEEFRARVIAAGASNGAATEPAVREELSSTDGVSSLRLLVNRSPIMDANGVAGFHVEAIMDGGTPEAIGLTLLTSLGATTPTQGTESVKVVDVTDGEIKTFNYSRLTLVRVVYKIAVQEAGAELPRDADAVAKVTDAVIAYTASLGDGIDVSPAFAASQAVVTLTPGSAVSAKGEAARFGGILLPVILPILPRERTVSFGNPQPATLASSNFETFNLISGSNFDFAFDGGTLISVVFTNVDFPFISAATAVQIATILQEAIDDANAPGLAAALNGLVILQSTTSGPLSTVEILGSSNPSALVALGFLVGVVSGTDTDVEVVFE